MIIIKSNKSKLFKFGCDLRIDCPKIQGNCELMLTEIYPHYSQLHSFPILGDNVKCDEKFHIWLDHKCRVGKQEVEQV